MLLVLVALSVASPRSHLAVCDTRGMAYLGSFTADGFVRETYDGTDTQLDRLLSLPWSTGGAAVSVGPVSLTYAEGSSDPLTFSPAHPLAYPGLQILLGPCKEPGVVYLDQPWEGVDALAGHRVAILEPAQGEPVLRVDGALFSLGTWWDEVHVGVLPRTRELQLHRWDGQALVVAPCQSPFSVGWRVVYLGPRRWSVYVETQNTWD